MKSFQKIFILLFLFYSCKVEKNSNSIEEWVSLFNGKDLNGWNIKIANHSLNDNFNNTFQVQDSMIRVVYDEYEDFDDKYGHMYYKTPYSYYKLRFDYRFLEEQTSGGENWNVRNSGVMIHSQSAKSNALEQHFPVSLEIQLLGGLNKGVRTTANLCTPGTAVYFNGKLDYTHCITSESKTYNGDQWVHIEAIILGNESILHIVENDTVLKYTRPEIDSSFLSKDYKGIDWDNFGVTNKKIWLDKAGKPIGEGYIALQAESHPIDFKNIELLDLCGCMDKKAKNYKSYFIKNNSMKCIY
ncbi:MAG: hypothetical protein ACI914_001300 [Candidatus Marivariicella framensis]|jgi:hypothetical protein